MLFVCLTLWWLEVAFSWTISYPFALLIIHQFIYIYIYKDTLLLHILLLICSNLHMSLYDTWMKWIKKGPYFPLIFLAPAGVIFGGKNIEMTNTMAETLLEVRGRIGKKNVKELLIHKSPPLFLLFTLYINTHDLSLCLSFWFHIDPKQK